MTSPTAKKRGHDEAVRPSHRRPTKKQRKQRNYHSDSGEDDGVDDGADDGTDFQAVDLLASDEEDLHNARADDGMSSASDEESDDPSGSESDDVDAEGNRIAKRPSKSKRNDPSAFATSLSRILSAKLSASRRSDPVLARSASARESSQRVADLALEEKARRQLRQQKRLAMEKGRVRDVLVASGVTNTHPDTGEAVLEETTASILATERRLRKVAQRGVVKLFNAVRAAQVKAVEAEREARSGGTVGVARREAKVTEMSRKGFLDLIASGGGGLKKGGLEEA